MSADSNSASPTPSPPVEASAEVVAASQNGLNIVPESLVPTWEILATHPLLSASLIVLVFFLGALLLRAVLFRVLHGAAKLTETLLDDKIVRDLNKPIFTTIFLVGVIVAVHVARLPVGTELLQKLLLSGIIASWMKATFHITTAVLELLASLKRFSFIEARTVPLLDLTGKLLVILVGSYILLLIWGINPVGWLASAGIVGIAVGFAAKDTLANLFSGFFIVADAPYKIGDYINLDSGERGRVSAIGLRSTRLITRDDVEITIPNGVIAAAKIVNESGGPSAKMRIGVMIGVAYGSDVDEVCRVLVGIGQQHPETCGSPEPRVRMRAFGPSSLDFELLCWIDHPQDRGRLSHDLLTNTYRALNQHGIEIPYAKQDVFIKEWPSNAKQ